MIFPTIVFVSVLLLFFANAVILLNHPVKSVLSLAGCFLCVSILWLIFGAEYLALVLIFLYVGAVMTLFLFMVMMMNVDSYSPEYQLSLPLRLMVLAITVGLPCGLFGLDIAINAIDVGVVGQATGYTVTSSEPLTAFSQTLYQEYFGVLQLIGLILAVPVVLAAGVVKQTQTRISKQQDSQAQLQVDVSERLSLIDPKQTRKQL